MSRELRPTHDQIACDVCERTILKGERTETFLAPGGHRKTVCQLCTDRAHHEGWIRESAHGDSPASLRRPEPRRGLFSRLRGRRDEGPLPAIDGSGGEYDGPPPPSDIADESDAGGGYYEPEPEADRAERAERAPAPQPPPPRSTPKDPRHVRAVPTNAQVKVERALELFNQSEHPRTIAGIARTLGEPWVCAVPLEQSPAEVALVVAWELSWYRFQIDLGAEHNPVTVLDKGHELEELDESLREWNASAVADGRIGIGVRSER
jgi:hypothetical protein